MKPGLVAISAVMLAVTAGSTRMGMANDPPRANAVSNAPVEGGWIQLFNGKDIDDWLVKLNGHELGDNYRGTFRAEAIVRGNDSIVHIINGEKVLAYTRPRIGGGVVAGYDPKVFQEGKALDRGFIGLQSEGQPIDFRKVELKVLRPGSPDNN